MVLIRILLLYSFKKNFDAFHCIILGTNMQHIPTRAFGANLSIDCNDLFIDELDEHGNVIVADIFHDLLFLLLGDVL